MTDNELKEHCLQEAGIDLERYSFNELSVIKDALCRYHNAKLKLLSIADVSGTLPTDEDISKKAQEARVNDINDSINRVGGFIVGATWMRDLLKENDHIGEANEMV